MQIVGAYPRGLGFIPRLCLRFTFRMNTEIVTRALHELLGGLSQINSLSLRVNELQKTVGELRGLLERLQESKAHKAEGWLDTTHAAKYLGISRTTFQKYRKDESYPLSGTRLDGKIVYRKEDLDRYVEFREAKKSIQ